MITLENIRCKRLDIIEQSIGNSGGSQSGGSTIVSQIQADWNQSNSSEVDYIKNKPTIPAEQIQSDWNESDTNSKAYIQNKPNIPSVPGNESASQGGNTLSVVTTEDFILGPDKS